MKTCVVVADRARARFFVTAKGAERMGAEPADELQELEALTDPEGELTGEQLFSNTRSGSNRSPHGAQFEYDDHRDRHRDEEERRFARRMTQAIQELVDRERPTRLVLAVEPRMLGLLRQTLNGALAPSVELVELPKDLSWHTPQHIRAALLRTGAIADPQRR